MRWRGWLADIDCTDRGELEVIATYWTAKTSSRQDDGDRTAVVVAEFISASARNAGAKSRPYEGRNPKCRFHRASWKKSRQTSKPEVHNQLYKSS